MSRPGINLVSGAGARLSIYTRDVVVLVGMQCSASPSLQGAKRKSFWEVRLYRIPRTALPRGSWWRQDPRCLLADAGDGRES